MDKVFVDTDIVLDVLTKREPFYQYAAYIFSKADKKEIKLAVSSLTFANLNYLLSKKLGTTNARKKLLQFKTLVEVMSVDNKIIDLALGSSFKDFEDAVQYYCAIENGYPILLTRNLPDYKKANIPVMTAESYVKS